MSSNNALLLVPLFLVRAIYLLVRRRLRQAILNVLIFAAAIGVAMWAMWFDAATLVYMT